MYIISSQPDLISMSNYKLTIDMNFIIMEN